MAKIYAAKIRNHATNPATGKEWCIEDVPSWWREDVAKLLEEE